MNRNDSLKTSLGNFLRTMYDLMILNWLWIICSLPVITIGPATCALFSVTLKLCRDEAVHTVKDFFREFRASFRQGFVLSLVAVLLAVIAAGDAYFALQQAGLYRTVFLTVAIIVATVCLTFISYSFPLQAMFRNGLKGHIQNAFALAFVAPGKTISMWLIGLFPIVAALFLPQIAVQMLGFVYLMVGISGPVYLNSGILRKIFDKVTPEPASDGSAGDEET